MTDDAEKKSEGIQDAVDNRLDDLFAADDEDAGEKSEGIQDVVDNRLDDLFSTDDEDAGEEPEGIQDVVDDRLDDLFSADDEIAGEESEGIQDVVDNRLDDMFPEDDEVTESAEKDQVVESHLDDSEEAPEIHKAEPPDKSTADETEIEAATTLTAPQEKRAVSPETGTKKPAATDSKNANAPIPKGTTHSGGDNKIGAAEKKPDKTETTVAPGADKAPPQKDGQWAIRTKPAVSKKEKKKTGPEQKQNNRASLKLILGGIVIIGGALAFFFFSQSPEPPDQSQPVPVPKTHKIAKLPAKAPETDTTPPAVTPVPQQVTTPIDPSEISSTDEKTATTLTPVAAPPTDKTEPVQLDPPVQSASAEIARWLLKWAAAWEKCAGKNGDMTAFMSFYSDDFSSKGFDKNRWHKDKLAKNLRKEWIRIKLDHIKIVGPLGNGRYEARFTQVYKSSNYADSSKQILILKNETSGWKIIGIKPQTVTRYPYAIHGGSFRSLPDAQKVVAGYRKKGLEAYWTRVELPGKGTWYRVFMGYYNSRESALKIIADKVLIDARTVKARYANLIGTYSSEDELQRQRRFIIEKGCSPYVISDDNGDFNLYTGAYTSLENAEKYAAELNARGISSQVVER